MIALLKERIYTYQETMLINNKVIRRVSLLG